MQQHQRRLHSLSAAHLRVNVSMKQQYTTVRFSICLINSDGNQHLHFFYHSFNDGNIAATAAACLHATTAGACHLAAPVSSTALRVTTVAAASSQRRRRCDTAHIRSSSFSIFNISDCAAAFSTMQRVNSAASSVSPTMQRQQRSFSCSFCNEAEATRFWIQLHSALAAAAFSSEPTCQHQY